MSRAWEILSGLGMAVAGVKTCVDLSAKAFKAACCVLYVVSLS
jgi:hypothetical protein